MNADEARELAREELRKLTPQVVELSVDCPLLGLVPPEVVGEVMLLGFRAGLSTALRIGQ